jgi:DNA-directed RNA polymerase subunit K
MAGTVTKFTKYEKARMIGARSLQISMGAPFLVKLDEKQLEEIKYNPVEIAKMEYNEGLIPLTIVRKGPEFFEDKSKHPIAEKLETAQPEEADVKEIKIEEEEDADEVEEEESKDTEEPAE